ncbi:MAG TPA: dephospho-CoA kinase [Dinghuibacter sp.]|uniref:dephospho-CoA kinase n=1 Tax=Dinghuibacter sp. TaxID=2024697 RepID=UPI002C90E91C|nr:dephospho-CoA kinase [Dinghuibacter sp.]HTJ14464.1 dephospho-CoA kinase [Dinghuibacter sp.]
MLKVGLTGGIGSGKSTVAKAFEVLGIPVYSSDLASRRLMNEDPALMAGIREAFGDRAYAGGQLDRSYLASIVFKDKAQLTRLNALVHPATIRDGDAWIARQTGPFAIRESSLIFEAGMQGQFDRIIGVSAPTALRIKRVMDRDHVDAEAVRERMRNQIQERIKMRLCDIVIVNDDLRPLLPQVLAVHERLISEAGSTTA